MYHVFKSIPTNAVAIQQVVEEIVFVYRLQVLVSDSHGAAALHVANNSVHIRNVSLLILAYKGIE